MKNPGVLLLDGHAVGVSAERGIPNATRKFVRSREI
jgi:hypothetical protein